MKSYMTQRQWRLVGKAWEIREHLRRQARVENRGTTVGEFLDKRIVQKCRPLGGRHVV